MKPALASILLLPFVLLAIVCGGNKSNPPATAPVTGSGTEQPAPIAATVSVIATGVVNVCGTNPAPAQTGQQPSDFFYRQLSQPTAGMVVRSPLVVSGQANPFEGAFGVSLVTMAGQTIASQNYFKDNQRLAFSVQLPFSVTTPTQVCVWVFESSGRDGSPINITQVPVTLQP